MARFRDIKTVVVHANPWTGVQEVNCPIEAENFDFSGDDMQSIRRVDVTKMSVALTISVQDPLFKRDISSPQFGTSPALTLNEVLRITMSESCDEIIDSADDDEWLTYVGVTRRVVEAEIELRDFTQQYDASVLKIGDLGKLQFDSLPGSALSGLANRAAYERFFIDNAYIVGINPTLPHGDLSSGAISLRGAGDAVNEAQIRNTLSGGGSSGFEIHPGDSGTITFTAPSTAGAGGDKDVSIANCVCTRAEIVAVHAGRLERRFNFRAYSSDGTTSPISVT